MFVSYFNPRSGWIRLIAVVCLTGMVQPVHLSLLLANPSGGNVQAGSATISSRPGQTTVTQSSNRAVIHWNDFSVRQGETTTFVQPSSSSATLNRVTGSSVSRLNGNLNANGRVYLVNRNGVVIGKSGRVNTSGFIASTSDVASAEFMKGGDLNFSGNSTASVINYGKIRATDGDVTLIARRVENHGTLRAKNGRVQLAAGTEVLLKSDGAERVYIKPGSRGVTGETGIINTGKINAAVAELKATGGNEYALAINNTGVIRANGSRMEGGRVYLSATGGRIRSSGTIRARNFDGSGGEIRLASSAIELKSGSLTDASGSRTLGGKGGRVFIGGEWQGGGSMEQAQSVTVEDGARILANATLSTTGAMPSSLDGGMVVLWSTGRTEFDGSISAQGLFAGTGGLVETSGHDLRVGLAATVLTRGGEWLLDPATLDIVSTVAPGSISGGVNDSTSSSISVNTILTALGAGNVTLQATSTINVLAALNASAVSGTNSLTLNAPTVQLSAPITMKTGATLAGSGVTMVNVNPGANIQNAVTVVGSGGTINIAAGTYTGRYTVGKTVTITGAGEASTVLDGSAGGSVFTISASGFTVTMNSFSITNGKALQGGGIMMSAGTLTLNNVTLYANRVSGTGNDEGGALWFGGTTLLINQSTFRDNVGTDFAGIDKGGALMINSGNARINQSVFYNNTGMYGGAIYNSATLLTIDNSTLANNIASDAGGAIRVNTNVNINSSTIYGNKTSTTGGGLGRVNGIVKLANTIVAGNTDGYNRTTGVVTPTASNGMDVYTNVAAGIVDGGFNYIGIGGAGETGIAFTHQASSTYGTFAAPANPLLAPLDNYGGTTLSMQPLQGSTVIDSGNTSGIITTGVGVATVDQRGIARPQQGTTDKGAFEARTVGVSGGTYTVTNTSDYNASQSPIANSFRLALSLSEVPSLINFNIPTTDTGYNGAIWTIRAATGTTGFAANRGTIATGPIIDATTQPGYSLANGPLIVLDGNNLGTTLTIIPGSGNMVTVKGLGITAGTSSTFGGGIRVSNGNLTINDSDIYGNTAFSGGGGIAFTASSTSFHTVSGINVYGNSISGSAGDGGGIYLGAGNLNLRTSAIYNNTASGVGGGIASNSSSSSVFIHTSTVSNNTASSFGGIFAQGTWQIFNTAIVYNTAQIANGGLTSSGNVTISNSIVALNNALAPGAPKDVSGAFIDSGNNLIGNVGPGATSSGWGASTIQGTDISPVNPLLGPIGTYGGHVQVYALLPGSPAIDSGNNGSLATDVRGVSRPYNAAVDMGPFEARFDYGITSGSGQSAVITQAFGSPVIITVTSPDSVYGYTDFSGGNVTLVVPGSGASASGVLTAPISGTQASFALSANGTVGGPYAISVLGSPSASGSLTNTGAYVTIRADAGQSREYGFADPTLTYSLVSGSLIFGSLSGNLARAAGENVGDYLISIGNLSAMNPNYVITLDGPVNFHISPRLVTVAPDASQGKIYGNPDPSFAYDIISGSVKTGDSFTGSLIRVMGEDVGNFALSQGSLTLGSNYALAVTTGVTFGITPRDITVTPTLNQRKTYGDLDPASFSYDVTFGSLLVTDAFTGKLSRSPGENTGSYLITQGDLELSTNYTLTFASGVTFGIDQRAISIRPDANQHKLYGTADPTFTYSLSAGSLAPSDTSLNGQLNRTGGENAGLYTYTQGNLNSVSNPNYAITFDPAPGIPSVLNSFQIDQRVIGVAPISGQSKVYGSGLDSLPYGYTITSGVLYGSDDFSGALVRSAGENAGNYSIFQGSLALGSNYVLNFDPSVVYTISQRPISIAAVPGQFKVYGDADPGSLAYNITSGTLAGSDTLSGGLARVSGENVGNYSIGQGTLNTLNNLNYAVTFVTGAPITSFGITPRAITVTPSSGQGKDYDGTSTPLTGFGYTITSGMIIGADDFSGALDRHPGVNVGLYAITPGTLTLGSNYTLSVTPDIKYEISRRPVTVMPQVSQSKIYGEADPIYTYDVTSGSVIASDSFAGNLSRVAGVNVNDYAYTIGTLSLSSNYDLTFNDAGRTFRINARPVTLTPDGGQSKPYGTSDPVLTYSVNGMGLATGDTETSVFTGALSRVAGETVGNYDILPGTVAANSNYVVTFDSTSVDFSINPRYLTITANAGQGKIYGAADPSALTYTITGDGLLSGDMLTGALVRADGQNVGAYGISQGTLAASSDYVTTYVGNVFSITPAMLTVAANNALGISGDPLPVFSGRITGFVNGDSTSVVSGLLYSTPATIASPAGFYTITPGSASAENYLFTYLPGVLTLSEAPVTPGTPTNPPVDPGTSRSRFNDDLAQFNATWGRNNTEAQIRRRQGVGNNRGITVRYAPAPRSGSGTFHMSSYQLFGNGSQITVPNQAGR